MSKKWSEILNFEIENLRAMTIDELNEHKDKLLGCMRKMLDRCDSEERDLKTVEAESYDEAEKYLRSIERERDSRPINQPPAMSFTSGENVPARATTWGGKNLQYRQLFPVDGTESNENVEQFIARAFSQRTMVTGVGASGGFTVPDEMWSTVFDAALAESIAMPRCRLFPMQTGTLSIPALDSEDQSEGWTAGVQAQWRAEGAAFDLVTPKFRAVTLSAAKYGMFINASSEILADSPNLSATVSSILVQGVVQGIDSAVIAGSGVPGPLGVLNSPCAIDVERATANLIDYADISNMFARLHPSMIPGAVWLASPDTLPQFLTLQDPASQYIWMPNSAAAGPSPGTLLGLPLLLSDKVPSLGSRGDLMLTNLNYYALGIRKNATVESTNSAYWSQDLVSFRVLMRVDGHFLLDNAITPANGGDTLSCAVILS